MTVLESSEEWFEGLERDRYQTALPWERYFINRRRRREGKPALR
jgi:hypothetical protein